MNKGMLRERHEREIKRIVARLRESYGPEGIILFGSGARGEVTADSEIDLLIIKNTTKRRLDRMREVYELVYSPDHYLALDPLVYTAEELSQRLEAGDSFIEEILRDGKVLYEKG